MIRRFEFVVLGGLIDENGFGGNYKIILKLNDKIVEESELYEDIGDCVLDLHDFICNNSDKYGFCFNGGDRVELNTKDCVICSE